MGAIRDLWDDGDPQAPAGFKAWGEAISDVADEPAMELVDEVVLGEATTTVNLTCPAGTYRSLRVIARCRPSANSTPVILRFNDLSGATDYTRSSLEFNDTTATSFTSNDNSLYVGTGFVNYANLDLLIPDKQNSQRGGVVGQFRSQQGANHIVTQVGGRLVTNVDITEVRLIAAGSTFQSGAAFYLYGIR